MNNHSLSDIEVDLRAVQAALRDMDRGETGQPFEEFAVEFCLRNGIHADDKPTAQSRRH